MSRIDESCHIASHTDDIAMSHFAQTAAAIWLYTDSTKWQNLFWV